MVETLTTADETWLNGLALQDRFGDSIHLAIASALLATLPINSVLAGTIFGVLVLWYLIRLYFWKPYMLSGPMWILVPGVIWIGFLGLSLLWSPDQHFGFRQVFANRWMLLVPMLWPLMTRWKLLLLAALAGCLVQAFAQSIESVLDWEHANAAGLNEHPRPVAAWMAAAAVGVVTLYVSGVLKRWAWLLCCIPIAIAIILTSSRGATAGLTIGIIMVSVVLAVMKVAPPRRLLLALGCLLMIGVAALIFQARIQPQMQRAWDATSSALQGGPIKDIRLVWWRSCIRQWSNHPLFGYGVGGTMEAFATDEQLLADSGDLPTRKQNPESLILNQPHSAYFQILLEGGLVGIALLILLLGSIVAMCLRTARIHPIGVLGLGVVIVWMVTAAFDSWHAQGQPLALLWAGAAFGAIHPACLSAGSSKT